MITFRGVEVDLDSRVAARVEDLWTHRLVRYVHTKKAARLAYLAGVDLGNRHIDGEEGRGDCSRVAPSRILLSRQVPTMPQSKAGAYLEFYPDASHLQL